MMQTHLKFLQCRPLLLGSLVNNILIRSKGLLGLDGSLHTRDVGSRGGGPVLLLLGGLFRLPLLASLLGLARLLVLASLDKLLALGLGFSLLLLLVSASGIQHDGSSSLLDLGLGLGLGRGGMLLTLRNMIIVTSPLELKYSRFFLTSGKMTGSCWRWRSSICCGGCPWFRVVSLGSGLSQILDGAYEWRK